MSDITHGTDPADDSAVTDANLNAADTEDVTDSAEVVLDDTAADDAAADESDTDHDATLKDAAADSSDPEDADEGLSLEEQLAAAGPAPEDPPADQTFMMAGTEKTFEYVVVYASTGAGGRVGVRCYRTGQFRIRLEPSNTAQATRIARKLTPADGWKQPGDGGQSRFSQVATSDTVTAVLTVALAALNSRLNPTMVGHAIEQAVATGSRRYARV